MSGKKVIQRTLFCGAALWIATVGVSTVMAQTWQPIGPAPIQTRGLGNTDNIPTNSPASGAIHGVAPHPSNADIIYVAAINGGVWRTTNATSANPVWVQQTDNQQSLSISDIAFDPTDNTNQTLLAGYGRFSSFASRGGDRSGLIRTTDGGTNWTPLDAGMAGRNISKVVARGNILLASVDVAETFTCGSGGNVGLWRSTNSGNSFSLVTNGLIGGSSDALAEDPTNNAVLYVSMTDLGNACGTGDGIFRSADTGASWSKVSDATMDGLINDINNTGNHFEIAVGPTGTVFVSIVPAGSGEVAGVFYSTNSGGSWTRMDVPLTDNGAGIHPGGQGSLHSSLAADPNDADIVYIGGDRQPRANNDNGGFPNSIGASSFSGRLFRGDITQAFGSEWTPITHNGTSNGSAPHPDSRDMAFDANGALLETDDGGIYRRTSPLDSTGAWIDVNGSIQVTEQHSGIFDANSQIAVSGNQDNGTTRQQAFANGIWETFQGGDGGDVAVDELLLAGVNQSVRYASSQGFGGARRLIYDQNNGFIGSTGLALTVLGGGAPLQAQFTTPISVNQAAGGRLIVGGNNAAYESLDQGDTITQLLPAVPVLSSGRRTIAYGSTGNVELLYVVGQDRNLYQRTAAGGMLVCVFSCASGNSLEAVVQDPSDPSQTFVIEAAAVRRTTNTASSFSDITGNLISSFSPGQLRTLQYMEQPGGDALAVGADRGVYIAQASSGFSTWTLAATGMPPTPVFDLDYDPTQDRLVAFTLGRGAFAVTFSAVTNQAPNATADSASTSQSGTVTEVNGGQTSLLSNDSDPDGDNLTLQGAPVSGPSSGAVMLNNAGAGTFSYTHNGDTATTDSFTYEVCDDGTPSLCDSAAVTISINQPPAALDDAATVVTGGTVTELNDGATSLLVNDSDPNGNTLAINTNPVSGPASGMITLTSTGTFSYTHGGDSATSDAVVYEVCDNASPSLCSQATLNITITATANEPPQAVNDAASTTNGGIVTVLDSGQSSLLSNDSDPDGDNLTLQTSPVTGPTSGSVTLDAGGTFSYTHDGSFSAADAFTYRVCDDGVPSVCDDAVVNISIDVGDALCADPGTAIPDSGQLDNTINATSVEQLADMNIYLAVPHTFVGDLSASLTHVASGTEVDLLDRPGRPTGGPGFGCGNNDIRATFDDDAGTAAEDECSATPPAIGGSVTGIGNLADFNGETFQGDWTLNIADGAGGDTGSLDRWCLVPTLGAVANNAPTPANDALTVAEGATEDSLDGGADSVLTNDTDPDGDMLTVTTPAVTAPMNAASFTLNSNGTFSYTHNNTETLTDQFVYEVCDNGNPSQCAQAQVNVTITPVNDAPVAVGEAITVASGATATALDGGATSLLANDTDPEGDALMLQGLPPQPPANGQLTLNANGTFEYINDGQGGTSDSFMYQVCDNGTPSECSEAEVSITVTGVVNQPPVAQDDRFFTEVDAQLSATVADNDSDPDDTNLTFSVNTQPQNGQVSLQGDGSFDYTPDSGFSGTDSFVYDLSDGVSTVQATVTIAVGDTVFIDSFE
ncbi:MAG: Ig-like domain-containing protein [Lysobacterales bacterium]